MPFSLIIIRAITYTRKSLENEYSKLQKKYFGFPSSDISFDTELVSKVITELKRGKVADSEGLSNEHLIFSHPILPVILSRFFNLILCTRYAPVGFKRSYIVPIPKPNDVRTKALTCNDFREIAINPVISKVFEYCFLDRFQFLQFGFKNVFGEIKIYIFVHPQTFCLDIGSVLT